MPTPPLHLYLSFPPADVVEFFRQYYGPTNRAFASLDASAAPQKLREELGSVVVLAQSRRREELTVVPAEYLEVIAVRA